MSRRTVGGIVLLAAAAAIAVAVALIARGGRDHTGEGAGARAAQSIVVPPKVYPYPATAVQRFVRSCARTGSGEESTCACVVDDLQTRLPYADYAAADRAVRSGRAPPPGAAAAIAASTRLCRGSE
jgi:hypothetical protein